MFIRSSRTTPAPLAARPPMGSPATNRRSRTGRLGSALACLPFVVGAAAVAGATPASAAVATADPGTAVPTAVAAVTRPANVLYPSLRLFPGAVLVNGTSKLMLQRDGNLVLRTGPSVATWTSRTAGHPGGFAEVKANGQLVVRGADWRIVFASRPGDGRPARLVVGDDGSMTTWTGTRAAWTTGTAVKGYAISRFPAYGWTAAQWPCLNSLWERESGWNPRANNPSSGAYGIPQALPGTKMATAGADWRTNHRTQIAWGLGYIHDRYGSPCGAWAHSQGYGWYATPGQTALSD